MVTLTPGAHSRGDRLEVLLNRLDRGWKRVVGSRRPWRSFERQHKIGGVVRVLEVERGNSGWHPHFHALVLVEGKPSENAVNALVDQFRQRWCDAFAVDGIQATPGTERVAVEGHVLRRPERGIPAYLAKGHSDLLGRLAQGVAAGDGHAIEAVKEFQGATHRRKRIVVTVEASWRGRVLGAFRKAWRATLAGAPGPRGFQQIVRVVSVGAAYWLTAADSGMPGP